MLFAIHWTIAPEQRDTANARFKQSGGPPPEGVKAIGRWHALSGNGGVAICETDDPFQLGKWAHEWSDVLSFRIEPVTDDQGVSEIIA